MAECYSTSGWDLHLRRNLNDCEFDCINELIMLLATVNLEENVEDSLVWRGRKDDKSML